MPLPRSLFVLILSILPALPLFGVEGIDMTTGGHWRDPAVQKPWSVDGKNVYGTDGYIFYNVTPLGKDKSNSDRSNNNRPSDENLIASLPNYILRVTPVEVAQTAHSNGYLGIDHPVQDLPATVESGVLVIKQTEGESTVDALQIDLGKLPTPYGIRIGILINNQDKPNISPEAVSIRTSDGSWTRSIIEIKGNTQGTWVFFSIPPKHSEKSLILSLTSRNNRVVTMGGMVFDSPISADPQMPLAVTTEAAVRQNADVIWKATMVDDDQPVTWEGWLATRLLKRYRDNTIQLQAIDSELNTLPVPYGGEPTGSGGYLTSWQVSAYNKTRVTFQWDQAVEVDAVALLPLRLYLGDENGLTENAYWPRDIEIRAKVGAKLVSLAHLVDSQQEIRQSLPEFVTFTPTLTNTIDIIFTDLPKRIGNQQYAGGFSEVFIFSGKANIAPRAMVTAKHSREGYRVFSKDYINDEQTPLGLPEVGPRTSGGLGLSIRSTKRIHTPPIRYQLKYSADQPIDAVRIDPAVIYKPGQAFPVRFTVELLDAANNVLQSDDTHRDAPFKGPGLNPYTAHFPETIARVVRLNLFESSQPTERARPWIQISEMTPSYKGIPLPRTANVSGPQRNRVNYAVGLSDPSGIRLFWSERAAYDGMTQSGKLLTHREWLEGLNRRQRLLEEQKSLLATHDATLQRVRNYTLWSMIGLVLLIICCALYFTIHHRLKVRREMRDTRERIASDLHDDVGSNLGTINLHAEYLIDQIAEPDLKDRLKAIFKLSKESTFGLREVLHTTAPRIGRAQNLLEHLEELTQLSLFDVKYSLKLDPIINKTFTEPLKRKSLLLYYKEALYNIQHHAQCSEATITFQPTVDGIELSISDNGIGMTDTQLARTRTLRTLKLRAKDLHGTLVIESTTKRGTTLRLTIPN